MSPQESLFWQKVQRRASEQTPDVSRAILDAFKRIRDSLTDSQLRQLVETHGLDILFSEIIPAAVLSAAFAPVRNTLREKIYESVRYFQRSLPQPKEGVIAGAFDTLSPRVVDAIRQLDTKVIERLSGDMKETFRAYIENGLRDGDSPATIARGLRNIVGLSPNQTEAVNNYRRLLEGKDLEALQRQLRDRRFDPTLKKALGADGTGLEASQVERMTLAYEKKMIAYNANTQARTAIMDSFKTAAKLSTADAVDRGILDGDNLQRKWIGVGDDRERPEHLEMNDSVVAWDQPYDNGDNYAGEGSPWNCRCLDQFGMFPE